MADIPQANSLDSNLAQKKNGQSIFGVISFGVGLLSLVMVCSGMALLVLLGIGRRGNFEMASPDVLLAAICAASSAPLAILGLGGGVVGFFEQDRRRIFNVLGLILNILSLLILAATVVLGLIARGRSGPPPNL